MSASAGSFALLSPTSAPFLLSPLAALLPKYFSLLPVPWFLFSHLNREGVEELLETVVCIIRLFFKALVFICTWS